MGDAGTAAASGDEGPTGRAREIALSKTTVTSRALEAIAPAPSLRSIHDLAQTRAPLFITPITTTAAIASTRRCIRHRRRSSVFRHRRPCHNYRGRSSRHSSACRHVLLLGRLHLALRRRSRVLHTALMGTWSSRRASACYLFLVRTVESAGAVETHLVRIELLMTEIRRRRQTRE